MHIVFTELPKAVTIVFISTFGIRTTATWDNCHARV